MAGVEVERRSSSREEMSRSEMVEGSKGRGAIEREGVSTRLELDGAVEVRERQLMN